MRRHLFTVYQRLRSLRKDVTNFWQFVEVRIGIDVGITRSSGLIDCRSVVSVRLNVREGTRGLTEEDVGIFVPCAFDFLEFTLSSRDES